MIKKIIALLMVCIIAVPSISLRAEEGEEAPPQEIPQEAEISLADVSEPVIFDFVFEVIYENEYATLKLDRRNNTVRILLKETGDYFDTLVMTGQAGNVITRNIQRSDFNLEIFRDTFTGSRITMDSHTQSVQNRQVEYSEIDNGLSARFVIGDADQIHITMFPQYMSIERMEEFVTRHMTTEERTVWHNDFYRLIDGIYIRAWRAFNTADGSPTNVPIPRLRRLWEAFYEIGDYSFEELAVDNEYFEEPEFEPPPLVSLVMEYTLDGPDLIITVPRSGMEFEGHQPFSSIVMNPYFLSGSVYDEGYIFIPDGSGGIINFNNGMTAFDAVVPVFGQDPLWNNFLFQEPFEQATLPIYGMIRNGTGILAIIEEGAPVATIHANTSGRIDEFNRVFASFQLLFHEAQILRGGTAGSTINRSFDDVYDMDIRQRYIFLLGDDASYVGMARRYREYLLERGLLKTNETEESAPLFVDMIASAPRRRFVLGISYIQHFPMTTAEDAENILASLRNSGVSNIYAQFSHWTNGGMLTRSLDSIRPLRSIGGASGMRSLKNFAAENDVGLFPSVRAGTLFMMPRVVGRTNRNMLTRGISNWFTTVNWVEMVDRTFGGGAFMVSPAYWESYARRVANNLSNFGFSNISVTDMGNLLFGDYQSRRRITRPEALPKANDMLSALNENTGLMLSNPNVYGLAFANAITDLPFRNGGRRIVDQYIPFKQMLIGGHIPFSMPAYNLDSMGWRGFDEYLLRAVESRSGLKLLLTNESEIEFLPTFQQFWALNNMLFQTQFSRWENRIGTYYALLNDFFLATSGAYVNEHTVFDGGSGVRVAYDNGVVVYINYGEADWEINGHVISGLSFKVV